MAMINNNLVGSHGSDSEEENIAYPCPLPFPIAITDRNFQFCSNFH